MPESSPEIRRCSGCNEAAVLPGAVWQHTTFSAKSGIQTREFRCQACGKSFTIRPRARLIGFIIAGVLLLPTCMGLPILGFSWWWWTQERRIPLVPDAAPVKRRFREGPPQRICGGCGGPAVATNITRHTHNGVPTGTDYVYACRSCNKGFTLESPWGHIFSFMGTSLVAIVAASFLAYGTTAGWKYGGGGVAGVIGTVLLVQNAGRLLARSRNPVDARIME